MSKRFEDKVAIVTGGTRAGIGHAVALAFAREGAKVTICSRNTDRLPRASEDIRSTGAKVVSIRCDIQKGYLEKVREEIPLGRFGTPDEAASLVLFLASDDASYLSGNAITVGGGLGSI